MPESIFLGIDAAIIFPLLLVFLFLATELGNRLGRRHRSKGFEKGAQMITSSLLTLLALLLGFAVSMAESRYSNRIERRILETDTIGTAYLRAGLMSPSLKRQVEGKIREYLAARIEFYQAPFDERSIAEISAKTNQLEDQIWQRVMIQVQERPRSNSNLPIINSINAMFDSRSEQDAMLRVIMPWSITYLLLLVSVMVVAFVGYDFGLAGSRHFVFTTMLSLVVILTLFVTMDLDRARKGLIKIPTDDLVELQTRIQSRSK